MTKRTKWILGLLVFAAIVFAVVRFSKGGEAALKVSVEAVKRRTIVETVNASGKVHPETEVRVSAPIAGEVVQLLVQEGDTVTKGQLLARIQGERLASAAPRLQLPAGVPPGFESLLQNMQPQRNTGPSAATLNAPISGTVLNLTVKQGERVTGGDVMRIANMRSLEVRVEVNENNVIKVSVGDSADVELDAYNKRRFKGVVTAIGSGGNNRRDVQSMMSADLTAYEVRIRLLPSSYSDLLDTSHRRRMAFRPGMNARAEIKTVRRENVLSVPVSAVTSRVKGSDVAKPDENMDGESSDTTAELEEVVFVIKADGTAEKRSVITGIQDVNAFEIKNGLKEGEQVVTGPNTALSTDLRTGRKLKVVKRKDLFKTD